MNDYVERIEKEMDSSKTDLHLLERDLLMHISFYQHERLVHFLITMLVGIITTILLVSTLLLDNISLVILLLIFILLLIPYLFHYYYLENKVQYMYSLYEKINKKIKK